MATSTNPSLPLSTPSLSTHSNARICWYYNSKTNYYKTRSHNNDRTITLHSVDGVSEVVFVSLNSSPTDLVDTDKKWRSKGLIVDRDIDVNWMQTLQLQPGNYYFKARTSKRLRVRIIVV